MAVAHAAHSFALLALNLASMKADFGFLTSLTLLVPFLPSFYRILFTPNTVASFSKPVITDYPFYYYIVLVHTSTSYPVSCLAHYLTNLGFHLASWC